MHAWHEVTVHGSESAVRAFVGGFVAGYGPHGEGVVFAHDVGVLSSGRPVFVNTLDPLQK